MAAKVVSGGLRAVAGRPIVGIGLNPNPAALGRERSPRRSWPRAGSTSRRRPLPALRPTLRGSSVALGIGGHSVHDLGRHSCGSGCKHAGEGQLPVGGGGSNVAREAYKARLSGFLTTPRTECGTCTCTTRGCGRTPIPSCETDLYVTIYFSSRPPLGLVPVGFFLYAPSPWYFSQTSSETSCTLPARTSSPQSRRRSRGATASS